MDKRIITISRQFGSGGRDVGKQVADRLGIAFYDKEFIAKVARESGFSPAYIEEHGEYATSTSKFLFNLDTSPAFAGEITSIPDQLYLIQHNAILELANSEPCVIVGRCADYVLQDRNDALHVFLHADAAFRANRIVNVYREKTDNPQKLLEETDQKRKIYYEHYTTQTWGMAENYHLSLNTNTTTLQKCADIIVELTEAKPHRPGTASESGAH